MPQSAAAYSPLPDVLRACADEMALLAKLGLKLEQTLSSLAPMLQARDALVEEMQGLDRLVQHAAALHALLLSAASSAPADTRLDMESAIDAIALDEMSMRLKTTLFSATPRRRTASAGDLDFF